MAKVPLLFSLGAQGIPKNIMDTALWEGLKTHNMAKWYMSTKPHPRTNLTFLQPITNWFVRQRGISDNISWFSFIMQTSGHDETRNFIHKTFFLFSKTNQLSYVVKTRSGSALLVLIMLIQLGCSWNVCCVWQTNIGSMTKVFWVCFVGFQIFPLKYKGNFWE